MAADSGCAFQGHVEALVVRGTGPAVLVEPEAFQRAVGELELPGARLYQSSAGAETQLAGPDLAFRDWKSLEPLNMQPPERFEVRYGVRPVGTELRVDIQLTPGGGEPGYFRGQTPGNGSCVDQDCEIRWQVGDTPPPVANKALLWTVPSTYRAVLAQALPGKDTTLESISLRGAQGELVCGAESDAGPWRELEWRGADSSSLRLPAPIQLEFGRIHVAVANRTPPISSRSSETAATARALPQVADNTPPISSRSNETAATGRPLPQAADRTPPIISRSSPLLWAAAVTALILVAVALVGPLLLRRRRTRAPARIRAPAAAPVPAPADAAALHPAPAAAAAPASASAVAPAAATARASAPTPASGAARAPVRIFISYAHKDEALRVELGKHLRALEHEGVAQIWQDRQLMPGTDWKQDIDAALDQTDLILLLVSADFIASTNCMGEFERAVELEKVRTTRIIPVILRPCAWKGLELGRREVLPTDGRPVDSSAWSSRDEAWLDVVEGVRRAALAARRSV